MSNLKPYLIKVTTVKDCDKNDGGAVCFKCVLEYICTFEVRGKATKFIRVRSFWE